MFTHDKVSLCARKQSHTGERYKKISIVKLNYEVVMVGHYTSKEVADVLGVTRQTLSRWIKSGKLKAVNLSTSSENPRYRISNDEVIRILGN